MLPRSNKNARSFLPPAHTLLTVSQSDLMSLSSSSMNAHTEYLTRLLRLGSHYIRTWDFKSAEDQLTTAVSICEEKGDLATLLTVHKRIAKMWLRVHSVPRSLYHLKKMKGLAEQTQQFLLKMKAYRDIGTCYQLVRKYEAALVYFKKLLELAWYMDNIEMELCAYDSMGKQYYYLGRIDKAMYYNDRAWKGIVEKKNSPARVLACNAYEARRKPKLRITGDHASVQPDSANSSDLSSSELPSPINNSSTINGMSLLPHVSQQHIRLPPILKHKRNTSEQASVSEQPESEAPSFVLMSHLSLNRSLKNYQCLKDSRKIKVRVSRLKEAV